MADISTFLTIYINLEQTCPTVDLMETYYENRRYVQAWAHETPWGGKLVGFLPGHQDNVTSFGPFLENLNTMIRYLL